VAEAELILELALQELQVKEILVGMQLCIIQAVAVVVAAEVQVVPVQMQ
jgi:hypothetical protein